MRLIHPVALSIAWILGRISAGRIITRGNTWPWPRWAAVKCATMRWRIGDIPCVARFISDLCWRIGAWSQFCFIGQMLIVDQGCWGPDLPGEPR